MEIIITLPTLAVILLTYCTGRYLYFSFLKYRSGHQRPFDPRYNYRTSCWLDWQRGYEQGQAKIIHQYHLEQCCQDKAVLKWIKGYKNLENDLRKLYVPRYKISREKISRHNVPGAQLPNYPGIKYPGIKYRGRKSPAAKYHEIISPGTKSLFHDCKDYPGYQKLSLISCGGL